MAVSLLRGNWTYFPSLARRAEFVNSIGFRSDQDVVQDLALLVDGAAYEPEVTFHYRRHSVRDSIVRALDGTRFDEERRFFEYEARSLADSAGTKQRGGALAPVIQNECPVALPRAYGQPDGKASNNLVDMSCAKCQDRIRRR